MNDIPVWMTQELRARWPCICRDIGTCLWCLMKVAIMRDCGRQGFEAIENLIRTERAAEAEACAKLIDGRTSLYRVALSIKARAEDWREAS